MIGKKLFIGVEQVTGKQKTDTLLLVRSGGMRGAQIWINDEHSNSFKFTMNPIMKHSCLKCTNWKRMWWQFREVNSWRNKENEIKTKGRTYSKVVANESDDSIEMPKIKKKSASKLMAKRKSSNKTMELLEAMNEMQKM